MKHYAMITAILTCTLALYSPILHATEQGREHVTTFDKTKSKQLLQFCKNFCPDSELTAMQKLLQNGADPNYSEDEKKNKHPIHALLKTSKRNTETHILNAVKLLLQYKADVQNPFTWKAALLHLKSAAIWKYFFDYGLKATACHPTLNTPLLILAIAYDNFPAAKILVEHGADVNGRATEQDPTPLMVAIRMQNLKIIQLLVNAGANIEPLALTMVREQQSTEEITQYLEQENTIQMLSHACEALNLDSINMFFRSKQCTQYGERFTKMEKPLPHLVLIGLRAKQKENSDKKALIIAKCILSQLFTEGFDINATDSKGLTLLHHAQYFDSTELLEFLLDQKGIRIDNSCTLQGKTSLHYAAINGKTKHAKLLIQHRANRKLKDISAFTAFDYALHLHSANQPLLDITGNPNELMPKYRKVKAGKNKKKHKKRRYKQTDETLPLACQDLNPTDVEDLLKQGANPNCVDGRGNPPLLLASIAIADKGSQCQKNDIVKYRKIVSALLDYGAQPHIVSPVSQFTVLNYADLLSVELIYRIVEDPRVTVGEESDACAPLVGTISNSALEQSKALIKCGASTDIIQFLALEEIDFHLLSLLLENGAPIPENIESTEIPEEIASLFAAYRKNPGKFTAKALERHTRDVKKLKQKRKSQNKPPERAAQTKTTITPPKHLPKSEPKSTKAVLPVSPRPVYPKQEQDFDHRPLLHGLLDNSKAVTSLLKKEITSFPDDDTYRPLLLDIMIKSSRKKRTAIQYQNLLQHIISQQNLLHDQLLMLIQLANDQGDGHANLFHVVALLDSNADNLKKLFDALTIAVQEVKDLTSQVINQTDERGRPPLEYASSEQMKAYLQVLGAHTISPPVEHDIAPHTSNDDEKKDAIEDSPGKDAQTSQQWVEVLLQAISANKSKVIRSIILGIIKTASHPKAIVQQQMRDGKTLLHEAVEKGYPEAVSALIASYPMKMKSPSALPSRTKHNKNKKASPSNYPIMQFTFNVKDEDGCTPLQRAQRILEETASNSTFYTRRKRIIELLTAKGAGNLLASSESTTSTFSNPIEQFHAAIREGDIERMTELLEQEPQLTHSCNPKTSLSALRYAVETDNIKAVALLLAHGAPIEHDLHNFTKKNKPKQRMTTDVLLKLFQAFSACINSSEKPPGQENSWTTFFKHVRENHFLPLLGGSKDDTKDRFKSHFLGGDPQRAIVSLLRSAYSAMLTNPNCVKHINRHHIISDYDTHLLSDHEVGLHEAWKITICTAQVKANIVAGIRNGHMRIITAYPVA